MNPKFCPGCTVSLDKDANFCSHCGFDIKKLVPHKKKIPLRGWIFISGVSVVLCLAIWNLQGSLIGHAPKHTHINPTSSPDDSYINDEIIKAKKDLDKDPTDIDAQKLYVTALWNRMADYESPPSQLVFNIIEVLSSILRTSANEPQALIMMANISFNQKIFDKAVTYYQRYLAGNQDDYEARSSYASALAFMGRHNEALNELDTVLKTHPDYFQAIAYKSITLAQLGKTREAIELGSRAIEISPSEEARARFGGFLDSLKNNDQNKQVSNPVETFIREHQIAGRKFLRSETNGSSITLYFKDFPMSAMPSSVKDVFIAKIKAEAKKIAGLSEIIFIDSESKQELYRVKVNL